ncbi:glycoside hydrolase family 15 protein [Paraburkholderia strydomiana]|uniref:glycoside hydrolase family 15 protein n=1 Tax=Paraburkholderia strydomiana TaxID=1245417 RepID=UPI001BEBA842|nr:glycoside hydrolase family 15 protein [Paraburkholderia strydomiana]MBT2794696.1 glycoside hydrolase family 15 protein [Paraburkholderia strydomiana]
MASNIEDYALLGDGHAAALVARNGSIDWMCWPRFDSDTCFAALLGHADNGRWQIAPVHECADITRRYRGSTLILETRFSTAAGIATLVDFMPLRAECPQLIRMVFGESGSVEFDMQLAVRFDYGRAVPAIRRLDDATGLSIMCGSNNLTLRTAAALRDKAGSVMGRFPVAAGECVSFVLTYSDSRDEAPACKDAHRQLSITTTFWETWSADADTQGPYEDALNRSLITLKALIYQPTGAIVAAPTASLPEHLRGARNWDYRFCWLRDASLTLLALLRGGYPDEARRWRDWLVCSVAGAPSQLQILYTIDGVRHVNEWECPWLDGYQGAKPVRFGNGAVGQLQLDVFGEVMNALYLSRQAGLGPDGAAWTLEGELVQHLAQVWQQPDQGIWESRGKPQHYTVSKVMAWVAVDRAIRSAAQFREDAPVREWEQLRDRIHADICRHAFRSDLNSFTQRYGGSELDASLLLLPLVGFISPQDPRMQGTVAAIEQHLMTDGLVFRYRTEHADDGLGEGEGAFLACSFWLADNLFLQGKRDQARALFERLLSLRNDVGLLSEEYDVRSRRLVGNFPQAFSHIALVNTGLTIARGHARAGAGGNVANPDGEV